jgi:hypothetical protein
LTPNPTFIPNSTSSQTSIPKLTATSNPFELADEFFIELLERAKTGNQDIDFTQLRMEFTKTSLYNPYDFTSGELETSMFEAFNNKDYDLAIESPSPSTTPTSGAPPPRSTCCCGPMWTIRRWMRFI